jgi:predicted metalloprotease with PDZ domain
LPRIDGAIELDLKLPENWRSSVDGRIEDVSRSVIVAGAGLRTQDLTTDKGGKITLTTVGEWRFTDTEAAEFARQIFDRYSDLFGVHPTEKIYINILPFPERTGFGEWQAETRGDNVTIISSDMPFRTQSVQRLHEQLRHEMFHLWIPDLIKLTGNYDWFYEGFALYESLKLGVAVNRISFADYLDTLSRAATIDSFQTNRKSLIDASKNRTIGADTNIYARGMLVAFLCDAALLERSKGKRSVEDILHSLFENSIDTKQKDANTMIREIMTKQPELVPVIKKYIEGNEFIDISPAMAAIGLENNGEGKRISLNVIKKPTGRQKEILNKLGYNNWRKLSPNRK